MNSSEILQIVDAIHRDKNIPPEIVFEGIEQAILTAARKHFGEDAVLIVDIDRESGEPSVTADEEPLTPEEISELGRIAAQTAKQVIIQKIREAERDALHDEFSAMRSHLVTGTVSRVEGSLCLVNLGKVEAMLPRGEQIPGESFRVNERVRAVVLEVRKAGSRVKVILSRRHPDLVRRLFEVEIPEVTERVIEVRSLAREAGYRSKVAVSSYDSKVDCVGACVGVRGQRIKGVIDELAGERIDIVRWNDSLQVLVPNAMQPAEVEDVILCPMLGKVIVLVRDDQLSLAIGKKGQNVRLASKLVGWDIDVMTQERLGELLDQAVVSFSDVPHIDEDLAEKLVAQGFFTFDDLSVIEPDQLAALGDLTEEQCDVIVARADEESERLAQEEQETRQRERAARRAAAELQALEAQHPELNTHQTAATGETPAAADRATATESAATDEAAAAESPVDETAAGETDGSAAEAAASADGDTDGKAVDGEAVVGEDSETPNSATEDETSAVEASTDSEEAEAVSPEGTETDAAAGKPAAEDEPAAEDVATPAATAGDDVTADAPVVQETVTDASEAEEAATEAEDAAVAGHVTRAADGSAAEERGGES